VSGGETAIAWRRLASGLYFIGFGVLLLLTTQGFLPWSFWLEALAYWPVLLIALGIRVLFERSAAPWGVLLSPVVVLGTLAWMARQPPVAPEPPGEWVTQTAAAPDGIDAWRLDARLALARLDLQARHLEPGLLVSGRSASREDRARVRVERHGDEGRVRIDARREGPMLLVRRNRQLWELDLASEPRLTFDLDGAFLEGRIDLTGASVERVALEGAFNDLALHLPVPGRTVRLTVNGAFNRVRVVVPAGTPVRARAAGALVRFERGEVPREADAPGYDLRFEGFLSEVSLETARGAVPLEAVGPEK